MRPSIPRRSGWLVLVLSTWWLLPAVAAAQASVPASLSCARAPSASSGARIAPGSPLVVHCGDTLQSVVAGGSAAAAPASAPASAPCAACDKAPRAGPEADSVRFARWLAGALGVGSILFAALSLLLSWRGNGAGVISHWGGFGGDGSGWRMTPAASALAAALAFGTLALLLTLQLLQLPAAKP